MLVTILLVILILALIGGLPHWGYSRSWGYGPSGGLGLIVVILIVLLLMGRIEGIRCIKKSPAMMPGFFYMRR